MSKGKSQPFKPSSSKQELWKGWFFISALLVALVTYAAYLPAEKNKFTNWDDDRYILNNPDIKSFSKENREKLLHNSYEGNYHPVTMLSYAYNYHQDKLNPKVYIQTNVYLHVISTLLVFILLQLLIKNIFASTFGALLFGIHPLHVESVAWISERKDVLYCFFFLASVLLYVGYIRSKSTGGKLVLYIFSLLMFALSLLSKGMAVTLAVSLFLIDYLERRKLLDLKLFLEKIPFFVVAFLFGLKALETQQVTEINPTDFKFSFIERVAIAGNGFASYIGKLLLPFNLSPFYPYPDKIPGEFWILTIITILLSILLIYFMIKKENKIENNRIYLAGFLFFVFNVVLVLQLLPVGKAMMADRYTYVASIGWSMLFAMLIIDLSKKITGKTFAAYFIAGFYILFLFIETQDQIKVWNNSITLWNKVIKHHPEADIAWLNRGLAKHKNDQKEEAIRDYKKAVEVNPSMALAWNNLGSIHSEIGKHELALMYFNKALELDSNSVNTWMNRAKTKSALGDYSGSIADFTKYLQWVPDNPDVINDRGLAKYQLQDYDGALKDYDEAINIGLRLNSSNMGVYYLNRGLSRSFVKNYEGAFEDYEKALTLHNSPATVYHNRGILHCFLGNFNKGCSDLREAEKRGMVEAGEKVRLYCKNF